MALPKKIIGGFSVRDYAYQWINGGCLLHQWCSGGRGIDSDVIRYVDGLILKVKALGGMAVADDETHLTELRDYLQANIGAEAEKYVPDQWV